MVAAGGSVWQVSLVVLWEGFPCLPPIDVRVWACVVWHLLQRLQGQHLQVRGVLVVAKQERERDKRSVVVPHVATPPPPLFMFLQDSSHPPPSPILSCGVGSRICS